MAPSAPVVTASRAALSAIMVKTTSAPAAASLGELASLALAVWRTHPAAFAAFHQRLLEHPVAPAARSEALKLMSQAELDAALRDPWIDELIQADVHDWVAFSATRKNLPKLLISGKRILHGLPSGEADFIRVMEQELDL